MNHSEEMKVLRRSIDIIENARNDMVRVVQNARLEEDIVKRVGPSLIMMGPAVRNIKEALEPLEEDSDD